MPADTVPINVGLLLIARNAAQTSVGTHRYPVYFPFACTDLQFGFVNAFDSNEAGAGDDTDGTDPMLFNMGFEYPAGTIYRVTAKGLIAMENDGGGVVVTDPLPIEIPAGVFGWFRTFTNSATWHATKAVYTSGNGGFTVTTDLSGPGSAAIADATTFTLLIGPQFAVGRPLRSPAGASCLIYGDSETFASGDGPSTWGSAPVTTFATGLGNAGYAGRACASNNIGCINISEPGDTVQNFITNAAHFRRMIPAHFCGSAWSSYGRNDISAGRTLAQIQADLITAWSMMSNRGLRTFHSTIVPKTNSTDGWLTTTNQTPQPNAGDELVRVALNTWLRAGAPVTSALVATTAGASGALYAGQAGHPLFGIKDPCFVVESSPNSGLWLPPANSRTVADAVAVASNFAITSATAAFVAGDVGKVAVVQGAGVAGAPFTGVITVVNSATSISVQPVAPGTSVNPATLTVCDSFTRDGLHPNSYAHGLIAAALNLADFV